MNIVDSSGWLEYFADSKSADNFAKSIENSKQLCVPSIVIYEVFKKLLKEKDTSTALRMVAHMKSGHVINLDIEIALDAAKISKEKNLPMADSIILATAKKYEATIWTQDSDFKGFPEVKYFPKN